MMRNFQQKKGWRNILESKPVLVALGTLLLFFIWGTIGFFGKMHTTRENRIKAENEVAELKEEKAQLSADIAKLNTESGVEETIREKFGLAKEGEGLIIVVEDKNLKSEEDEENRGFFSRIWHWIF